MLECSSLYKILGKINKKRFKFTLRYQRLGLLVVKFLQRDRQRESENERYLEKEKQRMRILQRERDTETKRNRE